MFKNIRKKVQRGLVYATTGALLAFPFAGVVRAESPKVSVKTSRIVAEGKNPQQRYEALVTKMPIHGDIFATWENQGGKNFYKFIAQAVPISYGPVSIGAVAQHVNGGLPHEEAGCLVRIAGNPVKGVFAKANTRYFPTRNVVDGYALVDGKRVFADALWSLNTDSKNAFVRAGIDYKIGKGTFVGLEGKAVRKDLDLDYFGVRAGKNF